ncbi:Hypothetical protein CM240_1663 [Clostridium bornimense]|uniref:Sulfatase N-terminal domain-containing protein n=1 Tax=Clostridium bornimense TaxID=1216932 RepID=W6RVU8_9CLOT|nr:sulfatase-like hydrolase/transferase [Clostridium bornimense]CDM68821.1 Hypothetical protein CM240_1663 [Clostridium bornimense]
MIKLINEFNDFEVDIIRKYIDENHYIIFGTGEGSKEVVRVLDKKPQFFLDNNKEKYNQKFLDREVKSPNVLIDNNYEGIIIIASMYYKEIRCQLDSIIDGKNIICYNLHSIEEILYNHIKNSVEDIVDIKEKICYLELMEDKIYNVKSAKYIKERLYSLRVDELKKYIAKNRRKKNVIIYHLESISQEILNHNLESFKTIKKLQKKSINLTKFFSSATSTYMTMSYFFYGNDFELDKKQELYDDIPVSNIEENLFSVLEKNNYRTLSTIYWDDKNTINDINISHNKTYTSKNKYRDFVNGIRDFIYQDENPFAMYVTDARTHLIYQKWNKPDEITHINKLQWGYRNVDNTLENILRILEEKDILKDTIIICYGDHGDDYWSHNFNGGFAHGIEPYSNMIHVPAFIYSMEIPPINLTTVCSTIDMKNTILDLIGVEANNNFKYSGKSIFNSDGYAYSHNLLANQSEEKGYLLKSYSITNNMYTLIVSKNGLEMYAYEMDPFNHNNLLNFFEFKDKDILEAKEFKDAHGHFKVCFDEIQLNDIRDNYYLLVDLLKKRIIEKNRLASENKFDINNFNKIKERKYNW